MENNHPKYGPGSAGHWSSSGLSSGELAAAIVVPIIVVIIVVAVLVFFWHRQQSRTRDAERIGSSVAETKDDIFFEGRLKDSEDFEKSDHQYWELPYSPAPALIAGREVPAEVPSAELAASAIKGVPQAGSKSLGGSFRHAAEEVNPGGKTEDDAQRKIKELGHGEKCEASPVVSHDRTPQNSPQELE